MEESVADIAAARALTRGFTVMMRDLEAERLEGWLEEASGGPPELQSFAEGLRRDQAAVAGALSQDYSTRADGGAGDEAQTDQAPGLRQGQLRPAAQARAASRVSNGADRPRPDRADLQVDHRMCVRARFWTLWVA